MPTLKMEQSSRIETSHRHPRHNSSQGAHTPTAPNTHQKYQYPSTRIP
jgi:hypothetical protein